MPSTRYTVRLPLALDTAVQEYLRTAGTAFATLMRDALTAYLADTPPTGTLTPAPTPADRHADSLSSLGEQLALLRARVEALEQVLTGGRQPADSSADSVPTGADTPQARTAGGQRKLTPRQVRALRDKHRRGVPVPALMEEYGLSRASVFRYLQSEPRAGDTRNASRS